MPGQVATMAERDLARMVMPAVAEGRIELTLNPPPPVGPALDVALATALSRVTASGMLSKILGSHRWRGTEDDRAAGSLLTSHRLGTAPTAERVVVTNSTQAALTMLLPGLVGRGGTLLTEELTYPPIRVFADRFGFRVHGVPMDSEGLVPDAFERACQAERPQALYALPTLQNPTTCIASEERRRAIVEIARRYNLSVIEDDIYSLLPPDAPAPLAALAPEISWYVLGLAKSVAPGMKAAYVVAPSGAEAEKLFWPGVRSTAWMIAPLNAAIATELVDSGAIWSVIDAVRGEMAARHDLVRHHFEGLTFDTKPGALHVWISISAPATRIAVIQRLESEGVIVSASDQYGVTDRAAPEAIRIGIGNPKSRDVLEQALRVIRAAVVTSAKTHG